MFSISPTNNRIKTRDGLEKPLGLLEHICSCYVLRETEEQFQEATDEVSPTAAPVRMHCYLASYKHLTMFVEIVIL